MHETPQNSLAPLKKNVVNKVNIFDNEIIFQIKPGTGSYIRMIRYATIIRRSTGLGNLSTETGF